jgi:diaminopimelate epimerase
MTVPFIKAHGLGNDFVLIDARRRPLALSDAAARAIADRRRGVGCDQLILIEPARDPAAAAFMRIRNADGGEVAVCGNATRCVARLLMDEENSTRLFIETSAGLLDCIAPGDGRVGVDMGPARTDWADIPLAEALDTLHLPIAIEGLADPVAVGMGNPHMVFFVDDAEAVDLPRLGPQLEHHPLYPERANVEVVSAAGPDRLRVRVWERSAGITQACGTGGCAAAVAAHRRGLAGRRTTVLFDGGPLDIHWREDGHVVMTGPTAIAFTGELTDALLTGVPA